ncbi:glycosyltransferase family 9 protein [Mesorhizobium sp. CAU 1732]|uniref:glycosyltransferase family 9 protein n=1 Tax=Mesorhizobium sp. CAU 1732 TaxID=3140358 RepID=UPI003261AE0E
MVSIIRKLRRMKFDMSIDITDSKTSRLLNRMVTAKIKVGYSPTERPLRRLERQPANVLAKPFGVGEHFLDRYLSPLDALGFQAVIPSPSLAPLPEKRDAAMALLHSVGLVPGRFIAVHAGASFIGRQWQPERFAVALDALVEQTGLDVALVGGPDERELTDAIRSMTSHGVVSLAGQCELDVLLAVLASARLFVGNESGPMHMAAAAGTPVVGLFGLTDPARWGPVGVPSVAVRPTMPCPCVAPGVCKSDDPSKAFCVRRIEVDEVVNATVSLLARTEDHNRSTTDPA